MLSHLSTVTRPTRLIVVEHGMPYASDDMPTPLTQLRRRDVLTESWLLTHVFDPTSHFRYSPRNVPEIGCLAQFFAFTVYNPFIPVECELQRSGDYSPQKLIETVLAGLENDDDIIQQWFNADEVLALLHSANSWETMLLAVEAIGGGHEFYAEVAAYTDSVLGTR